MATPDFAQIVFLKAERVRLIIFLQEQESKMSMPPHSFPYMCLPFSIDLVIFEKRLPHADYNS